MKKKLIRLTESDLHRIVENSVRRVIKESEFEMSDDVVMIGEPIYIDDENFDDDDEFSDIDGKYNGDEPYELYYLHNLDIDDEDIYIDKKPQNCKIIDSYNGIDMYYNYDTGYYMYIASPKLRQYLEDRGYLEDENFDDDEY